MNTNLYGYLISTAFAWLALAVTACTAIKRQAIRGDFASGFDALIPERNTELTHITDNVYSYRWLSYRTAFTTIIGGSCYRPTASLKDAAVRVLPCDRAGGSRANGQQHLEQVDEALRTTLALR